MRIPFVAGNWKMNTTASEVENLLGSLKILLTDVQNVDVAVCPPFPYLLLAAKTLEGSRIRLGAQNMHFEIKGAFTGEVSSNMIKDTGCHYVILGHSERRHVFGETDEMIRRKIQQALNVGIFPILCVGETLEQREEGKTEKIIEGQLKGGLNGLSSQDLKQITIAYEPVWAIGTGKTATPDQAQEVHRFIRNWIGQNFNNEIANDIRLQYGGSVKPENAAALMNEPDIDGALVGGASLKDESFAAIIKASIP
jgi:triosephosphate isomerase